VLNTAKYACGTRHFHSRRGLSLEGRDDGSLLDRVLDTCYEPYLLSEETVEPGIGVVSADSRDCVFSKS
jgi:hypothetical protein